MADDQKLPEFVFVEHDKDGVAFVPSADLADWEKRGYELAGDQAAHHRRRNAANDDTQRVADAKRAAGK